MDQQHFPFDLNEPATTDGDIEDMEDVIHHFDLNEPPDTSNHHHRKRPKLSSDSRLQILMFLLSNQSTKTLGKPYQGAIEDVAKMYNVTRRTISSIWSLEKKQKATLQSYMATNGHNSGRKRIELLPNAVIDINMGDRSCIWDLVVKLKVSTSTCSRMIKRGLIKPHTNPLHPGLKDPNMLQRMKWILDLLIGDIAETKRQYRPMFNFVHIDEKWFYLSKKAQRVYLEKNEKVKYRSAKSSKFIPKVMFTATVAKPMFNEQDECIFDGKLGIFPFTYQELTKRTSKYRAKGTLITKVVESVGRKETRHMLINQIVPAIIQKWPPIQGPKYLMHKKMPKDVDGMMDAVNEVFYELEPRTLANVWLSYQYVMNEILKVKGSNDYLIPNVNKKKLATVGQFPVQVTAPMWVVFEA